MHFLPFRGLSWIVAIVFSLIVASSVYGFAASNTVAVSSVGDGVGAISGYTVGSITYALNSVDPSKLDTLRFSLTPTGSNPQPSTVKVQLVSNGTWFTGVHGTGTSWSIDLSSASISALSVDNLRVIAAQ